MTPVDTQADTETSPEHPHVVVVGAGLSGLRTAERLRRLGHTGRLTLVGEEEHAPYDRPPLSKALLQQEEPPEAPVALRAEEKYAELDLELRLGVRATRLTPDERALDLDDGSRLTYDRLVVATGARARRVPAWDHFTNVHTLRTFDDCLSLRTTLQSARHLTVVGAGVLGGEIAASARALGREVTLVEAQPTPLARVLAAELGSAVAQLHRDHGVDVRLGVTVERFEGNDHVHHVTLSDGTSLETDAVVLALGSVTDTAWLAGSGVATADGVPCDSHGATAVDGVFVVGDAALMLHPGADEPVRLEHWTAATDTAAVVAHNVLADPSAPQDRKPLTEVPYFWSDQYDVKVQGLGIPHPDDDVTVVAGDVASYSALAVCSRDGRVTAAFAMNMPAPLARCRTAVAKGTHLDDLLAQAPWTPKKKVAS